MRARQNGLPKTDLDKTHDMVRREGFAAPIRTAEERLDLLANLTVASQVIRQEQESLQHLTLADRSHRLLAILEAAVQEQLSVLK